MAQRRALELWPINDEAFPSFFNQCMSRLHCSGIVDAVGHMGRSASSTAAYFFAYAGNFLDWQMFTKLLLFSEQ